MTFESLAELGDNSNASQPAVAAEYGLYGHDHRRWWDNPLKPTVLAGHPGPEAPAGFEGTLHHDARKKNKNCVAGPGRGGGRGRPARSAGVQAGAGRGGAQADPLRQHRGPRERAELQDDPVADRPVAFQRGP